VKKSRARSLRAPKAPGPAGAVASVDAFVARQAILDGAGRVLGYQLLFRDAPVQKANVTDPDRATATVILNTLVHIGLDRVVGGFPMFIEFPKQTLLDDYSALLPSDRVILQIPAAIEPSIAVRSAISCLRGRGYKIALSNYVESPEVRQLLALCDYVKVDVLSTGDEELAQWVKIARKARAHPIANKVENNARYEACRSLGFEFFQGYFLADPQIVADRRPAATTRVLELLRLLSDPRVTLDQIDEIVRSDVLLSYRLIRCLNSAAFAVPQKIQNVRHALVMLGIENLRKWAAVLALSAGTGKPVELMRIALIRAQMCTNLGALCRFDSRSLFTVGLFSVLDALLDRPMLEILDALRLADDVVGAILQGEGRLGAILRCVIAYERGRWDDVRLDDVGIAEITSAWLRAVAWADALAGQFGHADDSARP
jgi:EAL and modified HD-GYP domain-containing signal transduction protein